MNSYYDDDDSWSSWDDDESQYNDQPSTSTGTSSSKKCIKENGTTYCTYETNSGSSLSDSDLSALMVGSGALILCVILCIAAGVVSIIGQWKVFEKMHHKGWESLIGGHNIYVMLEASGLNPALFFLCLIPYVGPFILLFWSTNALAKAFGKGTGYGIGLALLGFVFFPMLGFGNAQYLGPKASSNTSSNTSSAGPAPTSAEPQEAEIVNK